MQYPSGTPLNLPFLHLRGGDINAIGLTPTAHGKINVKGRQTLANITLGNDIESSRMIENVVVERELATKMIG
jgi:hypothetical protein